MSQKPPDPLLVSPKGPAAKSPGEGGQDSRGGFPLLMTVPEVADLLRTTRQAVYAMVARGQIPATRIGRRVLFSSADVLKWLDEKRTLPQGDGAQPGRR